jgi:hypothetical protein
MSGGFRLLILATNFLVSSIITGRATFKSFSHGILLAALAITL